MTVTHRNAIWGFIVLLSALAVLRSLSPKHTAKLVRNFITPIPSSSDPDAIQELRAEVKRESVALHKLIMEMDAKDDRTKQLQADWEEEKVKKHVSADPLSNPTPGNDRQPTNVQHTSLADHAGTPKDQTDEENRDTEKEDSEEGGNAPDVGEEDTAELEDVECPIVLVIESSKSGLGTQIEHVLSLLSVSLALQNACVVLPPINADDGQENFRPVAFREIFDEHEFLGTGVRTVPLSVCKSIGVSHVFDDSGAESAIVKNFAEFVWESDPNLAQATTLVHKDSKGHRFQKRSPVNGDVTVMAQFISERATGKEPRKCLGFGMMRAKVAINDDVLEHLRPASGISEYVSTKHPAGNETMFVELRWNRLLCESARTETGTVCIFGDNVLLSEEYVRSIAYTAQQASVSSIYLAMPTYVPEDVSEYISKNLRVLEPILLDVGGEFFTTSLIEHELAVRCKVFVSDGGAWGDTVQLLRNDRNSMNFQEGYTSLTMVQEWKNSGQPADLQFLAYPQKSDNDISEGLQYAHRSEHLTQAADTDPVDASTNPNAQKKTGHLGDVIAVNTEQRSHEEGTTYLSALMNQRNEQQHGQQIPGYAPNANPQALQTAESVLLEPPAAVQEDSPAIYVPPHGYVPSDESDEHLLLNSRSNGASTKRPSEGPLKPAAQLIVALEPGDRRAAAIVKEVRKLRKISNQRFQHRHIGRQNPLPVAVG